MVTVAEMKKRLPSDKRSRSKPRTVEALHYALNCVKQVQGNQTRQRDVTVCTLEELERVTSEHTMKNTDSFVVVFSLSSGRVLHASEQAPSILCCKRKFLESAKFVELLFHQDVNVFYSHTAQPHLPPWTNSHTAGVLFDCAQVKSFFCRIRGGKDRDGEMRYNPFRITPYLLKVQGTGRPGCNAEEEEPCCLALAERIISGYEAPRIPMDKRIFTTTHSPGCVFLEVDDRAVPLLGYLPQDLIGTSLLTHIHPEDRPLLLSMHRKVLKYAGQSPFEHSPVRLQCQNGDFITLDTSWSSFINPWSRKVAFIIGRHKVRTSPLNEDVFAARAKKIVPVTYEEIKDLQAKIYKLFLQPVHNNGSSGYGSLGSNGSHEHYISVASSSDSNGNLWEDSHREPMTLQQICAHVNRVKRGGQQAYLDSSHKNPIFSKPATATIPLTASSPEVREQEESRKQTHIPSYQQINCVDNIIRYLESCTGSVLKRKSEFRSLGSSSSSTSEDDKPVGSAHVAQAAPEGIKTYNHIGTPLTDITMSTKAMSVVSSHSYSSTIVHVPQPESEATALEDAPMGSEPTDAAPTLVRPTPSPAPEELRFIGLTKEVLSAHTQKEEQEYVDRFRHRILQSPYSSYLQLDNSSMAHSHHPALPFHSISSKLEHFLSHKLKHLQAFCCAHRSRAPLWGTKRRLLVLGLYSPALVPALRCSSTCCRKNCPNQANGRVAQGTTLLRASMNNMPMRQVMLLIYFTSGLGDAPSESGNHDAQSTSSELLDLLLQEDARSGTGSNASGSGSGESGRSLGSGSGSNGTSTSHTKDREKLQVLQPLQPWFTQEQQEELAEVHPWIQQHTIPQEIDTQVPQGYAPHTVSYPFKLSIPLPSLFICFSF
uniref:PAS domain-containing protein n=1 Tax=Gouania willdenowi TaxID=441366 RepID=A0A8C5GAN4_GOUWI